MKSKVTRYTKKVTEKYENQFIGALRIKSKYQNKKIEKYQNKGIKCPTLSKH